MVHYLYQIDLDVKYFFQCIRFPHRRVENAPFQERSEDSGVIRRRRKMMDSPERFVCIDVPMIKEVNHEGRCYRKCCKNPDR